MTWCSWLLALSFMSFFVQEGCKAGDPHALSAREHSAQEALAIGSPAAAGKALTAKRCALAKLPCSPGPHTSCDRCITLEVDLCCGC